MNDTVPIIKMLEANQVDIVEIGMPYSDPLADGPTIQRSSETALKNGITLDLIFQQIGEARKTVETPFVMMGYLNQVMQYGAERFFAKCAETGVDGLIIPDMPMDVYLQEYHYLIKKNDLKTCFLITPQTSEDRVRKADELSEGFLYMVARASITGAKMGIDSEQRAYFTRVKKLNLTAPRLIGFGISDKASFVEASSNANGAIIGSAFINALKKGGIEAGEKFIKAILD